MRPSFLSRLSAGFLTWFFATGVAVAGRAPYTWLEEECPPQFDLSGVVHWPAPPSPQAKVKIVFNYVDRENHYAVALTPQELKAVRVTNGKTTPLWKRRGLQPVSTFRLVLKRRSDHIALIVDGRLMGTCRERHGEGGRTGALTAGGVTLDSFRMQEIASLYFTDDFMRTEDQTGAWEPVSGRWKVKAVDSVEPDPRRSANPFSYEVAAKEIGLTVAGHWFWDSELFRAAVRPDASGAVGLVVFYQDPKNYALFRWLGNETAPAGNACQLVWVRAGKPQVVAAAGKGYQRGQWYQLMVKATDTCVQAFIDGNPVVTAGSPPFCSGKIGLYAQRCRRATFDDVFCRHWAGKADDPSPFLEAPRITEQFTKEQTMSGWASPDSDWVPVADSEWLWNRGVFWGDASLSVELPFLEERNGFAELAIHADGDDPTSGYVLSLHPAAEGSSLDCRLRRRHRELATKSLAVGEWPVHVELRRHEDLLLVEVGTQRVLSVRDPHPLPGTRTALRTVGLDLPFSGVFATGTHYLDDTFATAPVRWWQGKGNWHLTSRWSCSPGWTWLAGTGSMAPVLWTKKAFAGDFAVEAFVANKMDLPAPPGYSHPGNLNLTVCGDGRTLGSGYSFIYGGWDYTASGMFRQGTECVPRTSEGLVHPAANTNMDFHRHWFRVRVERRGNHLRHWVDDRLLSDYEDPHPIPAGRIALWTMGNEYYTGGIMVARVRVWYEREARAPDFPEVHDAGEESGPWDKPLPPVPATLSVVRHDFERDTCGWSGYNRKDGAVASVDTATAAGGKQSLLIRTAGSGGDFTVWAGVGRFDAAKLPRLRFAYKVPADVKVNLYLRVQGRYYAVEFTGGPQPPRTCRTLGRFADVKADNHWHHASFNLAAAFRALGLSTDSIKVTQLCFSTPKSTYYRVGIGGNGWGASYHLDDFELSAH